MQSHSSIHLSQNPWARRVTLALTFPGTTLVVHIFSDNVRSRFENRSEALAHYICLLPLKQSSRSVIVWLETTTAWKSQCSNATSGVWYLNVVMDKTAYRDVFKLELWFFSHFKNSPKQLAG
jgi:hypothetical protein